MDKIVICICTYKREDKLKLLLQSITEQEHIDKYNLEIIVVDNENNSNIKNVVDSITSLKITYYNEINKGIVNARNRCLKEIKNIKSDYIIFLDDDETVDKKWLHELMFFQKQNNLDIVCGPVVTVYPKHIDTYVTRTKIYNREILPTGTILDTCGCGNVLIKKSVLIDNDVIFDIEFNSIGGEDTEFFSRLSRKGYKIYFCAGALAYEELVESRSTLRYLIKRSFVSGISYIKVNKKHKTINLFKELVMSFIKILVFLGGICLFNIIRIEKTIFCITRLFINIGKFISILKLDKAKLY